MDEQPNTPTHKTRISRPLSPEQRLRKQARFLAAYRNIGIIKSACKVAGINRSTYYDWRDHDVDFAAHLPDAKEEANESLEIVAHEQAYGIEEPAISMGRIVYEEIPVFDENGEPKLDRHDHPMMRRGKMIMTKKYSPSVLITLLKANMPEKYKDRVANELTGKKGGPIEFKTEWGGGALEEDDESDG